MSQLCERKIYLLTQNDVIEIALIGPLKFDWGAAVQAFEMAEDLYYPLWEIPPKGTPPEVFSADWERWRTELHKWRKDRESTFASYNRLLADWLVRHHDFVIADFVIE